MMKEQEAESNFFVKRIKQKIKSNAVILVKRAQGNNKHAGILIF